jgi:hypothetical protein
VVENDVSTLHLNLPTLGTVHSVDGNSGCVLVDSVRTYCALLQLVRKVLALLHMICLNSKMLSQTLIFIPFHIPHIMKSNSSRWTFSSFCIIMNILSASTTLIHRLMCCQQKSILNKSLCHLYHQDLSIS